jgi:hypothetical protein
VRRRIEPIDACGAAARCDDDHYYKHNHDDGTARADARPPGLL